LRHARKHFLRPLQQLNAGWLQTVVALPFAAT
jgi:hypothetical protein